jgi:hypothetical protein
MAKKKATTESQVKLHAKELNETRQFGVEHANRIFKMKNHGWELNDTNYELKDGIITKRTNTKAQGAEEQGAN